MKAVFARFFQLPHLLKTEFQLSERKLIGLVFLSFIDLQNVRSVSPRGKTEAKIPSEPKPLPDNRNLWLLKCNLSSERWFYYRVRRKRLYTGAGLGHLGRYRQEFHYDTVQI